MKYNKIIEGIFLERPNRFIARVLIVYKFEPNADHHKEFADTLIKVRKKGVKVLVYDCIVTPDSIEIDSKIDY